mgnify:FL=1
MRIILFLFSLLILVSCKTTNEFKSIDNNKKQKKMIMKVTTEPSIKVKKWKYFQLLILKIKNVWG